MTYEARLVAVLIGLFVFGLDYAYSESLRSAVPGGVAAALGSLAYDLGQHRKIFWRWLMLFAYRRWKGGTLTFNPVGIPGQRDPHAPCPAYAPRKREPGEWGTCQTDGHYECDNCAHKAHPEPEREDLIYNIETRP